VLDDAHGIWRHRLGGRGTLEHFCACRASSIRRPRKALGATARLSPGKRAEGTAPAASADPYLFDALPPMAAAGRLAH
jgi:hypothetical protein